jgi:hypothetical protein
MHNSNYIASFAHKLCTGRISPSGNTNFSPTKKEDPPPTCVEPLPVELIKLSIQACHASNSEKDMCIANMIISFFFLCCPGEHTVTFDNKLFKILNVQFYKDDKPVPTQSSKLLFEANFLTPTFDTHKNSVNGMQIGHGHSTFATLYPILAVAHQVVNLNPHIAKPDQPLCSSYHTARKTYHYLTSKYITQVLCAVALHHLHFCVSPASVECCSLHTSGAMALFSHGANALLIKHVGHWHSDAMHCYLHVQSCSIMSGLSKLILAGCNPQHLVEIATMPLPNPSLFVGSWGARTTTVVLGLA